MTWHDLAMHTPKRMRVIRGLAFTAALAASGLISTAAQAAPGDTSGKKIRVGVDTEVFGFGHLNPDGGPADDGVNFVGFGVGRALLQEQAFNVGGPFGAATPTNVGVHVGAVLLDGRAVAGARVALSMGGISTEAEDDTHFFLFSGELIPYFRWLFMDGPIRPYAEFHFGFGGGLVQSRFTDPNVPEENNTLAAHVIAPSVGAGGGAMFFVADAVSIDLGLGLDYAAPHTRTTVKTEEPPVLENTDWEKASDNVVLNVALGISGWF